MESPPPPRTRHLAVVLLSVVATAIAARGMTGGFIWGDVHLVGIQATSPDAFWNALVRPFFYPEDAASASYYRPVVSLALAAHAHLFGTSTFGYHLVSLILQIVCAVLVMTWLERRLLASQNDDARTPASRVRVAATLGALLFVVHPSRPQVVSWISGSTDLWAALFALAACILSQRRDRRPATAGVSALLALALLSKETTIAVPFALLLDEALTGTARGRSERLRSLGVATVVSAFAFLARGLVVSTPLRAIFSHGFRSLVVRVLLSLGWELEAVVWPTNPRMQLNYDLGALGAFAGGTGRATLLGVVAAVSLVAFLVASRSRPGLRPWAADLGFFFALVLPSLNLVPIGIGTTVSERFVFLPLLGFSALLSRALVVPAERPARLGALATAAMLVGLAVVSVRETAFLHDEQTLQEHFHDRDPTELFTLDSLFRIYTEHGDIGRARRVNEARLTVVENVARRGGDLERLDALRANAMLLYVERELGLVDPDDATRLSALRTMARALATAPHAPRDAKVELARVMAFRGEFAQASEALTSLRDDRVAAGFDVRCRVAEAQMRAARAMGPRTATAAEAVLVAGLGLPARGRALLTPLWAERGPTPALVNAAVQVELNARAYERARALVERAMAVDAAHTDAYRAELARVETAAGWRFAPTR